jgi:hypothetical protein
MKNEYYLDEQKILLPEIINRDLIYKLFVPYSFIQVGNDFNKKKPFVN